MSFYLISQRVGNVLDLVPAVAWWKLDLESLWHNFVSIDIWLFTSKSGAAASDALGPVTESVTTDNTECGGLVMDPVIIPSSIFLARRQQEELGVFQKQIRIQRWETETWLGSSIDVHQRVTVTLTWKTYHLSWTFSRVPSFHPHLRGSKVIKHNLSNKVFREKRSGNAVEQSWQLEDCMTVSSKEEGVWEYISDGRSETCGLYLVTMPDMLVQVDIMEMSVDCSSGLVVVRGFV